MADRSPRRHRARRGKLNISAFRGSSADDRPERHLQPRAKKRPGRSVSGSRTSQEVERDPAIDMLGRGDAGVEEQSRDATS